MYEKGKSNIHLIVKCHLNAKGGEVVFGVFQYHFLLTNHSARGGFGDWRILWAQLTSWNGGKELAEFVNGRI